MTFPNQHVVYFGIRNPNNGVIRVGRSRSQAQHSIDPMTNIDINS